MPRTTTRIVTGRPATDHDEIDGRAYETRKFPVPLEGGKTGIGGLAGTPTGCKIAEIVTMSADTEEKD